MKDGEKEVKYVYQEGGSLLVPKKGNVVYQETTVANSNNPVRPVGVSRQDQRNSCWTGQPFRRFRLILSCIAIVSCIVVIIVLLTNGLKGANSREQAQEKEIAALKELVDSQQVRLHRMQKELQFLVTRQQAYEAKEDSMRRRIGLPVSSPKAGTGTGSSSWPSANDKIIEDGMFGDPDLPMSPRKLDQQEGLLLPPLDDEVDLDKLPRASANKKRKGKTGPE